MLRSSLWGYGQCDILDLFFSEQSNQSRLLITNLEEHRVWNTAFERPMVRVVQVVQRVDKGGVPPVDGALGTSELAKVVRDVLEQHPDHEHAKEGRQNDVHTHQLAQKAAEQFDTESAWSANWSQREPSVQTFNIFDLNDKSIFF